MHKLAFDSRQLFFHLKVEMAQQAGISLVIAIALQEPIEFQFMNGKHSRIQGVQYLPASVTLEAKLLYITFGEMDIHQYIRHGLNTQVFLGYLRDLFFRLPGCRTAED